jgi:hypothetical protein
MRSACVRDGEAEICAGPAMKAVEKPQWGMVVLTETQLLQTL